MQHLLSGFEKNSYAHLCDDVALEVQVGNWLTTWEMVLLAQRKENITPVSFIPV